MCQFARLVQATNLLSFVLSSISSEDREPYQSAGYREEEVMQLDRTLHALISLSEEELRVHENRRSCAGMSMCRRCVSFSSRCLDVTNDGKQMEGGYNMS
jgi:hypothetical protein